MEFCVYHLLLCCIKKGCRYFSPFCSILNLICTNIFSNLFRRVSCSGNTIWVHWLYKVIESKSVLNTHMWHRCWIGRVECICVCVHTVDLEQSTSSSNLKYQQGNTNDGRTTSKRLWDVHMCDGWRRRIPPRCATWRCVCCMPVGQMYK